MLLHDLASQLGFLNKDDAIGRDTGQLDGSGEPPHAVAEGNHEEP